MALLDIIYSARLLGNNALKTNPTDSTHGPARPLVFCVARFIYFIGVDDRVAA